VCQRRSTGHQRVCWENSKCVAVCCSVLQRVAMCWSVLKCVEVEVCWSVLKLKCVEKVEGSNMCVGVCCLAHSMSEIVNEYEKERERLRMSSERASEPDREKEGTPCGLHALQDKHTAPHCNTLQHTETDCNILQRTATHDNAVDLSANALQHTATHCNTLKHSAIQWETNAKQMC